MIDPSEQTTLHAKKKQLKLLMIMMLVFMFMVSPPLLGPRIFAKEFSDLKGAGLQFFYIATPAVFGALFLFDLFLYRRVEKKLRGGK